MSLRIREEQADDINSIRTITQTAFVGRPYSQGTEHLIVDALREQKVLTLSLVAEYDGIIAGHIAFSPITINSLFCNWYGLGPLSVNPPLQKQGIGSALVRESLSRMKKIESLGGIVVLGNPDYYKKFGFVSQNDLVLPNVPAEHFLVQSFAGKIPAGNASFHSAFSIKPLQVTEPKP